MLKRMWSNGNTPPLLVNANLDNHSENQYDGFSEIWQATYLRTQQYYSWAYTQSMLNPTTGTFGVDITKNPCWPGAYHLYSRMTSNSVISLVPLSCWNCKDPLSYSALTAFFLFVFRQSLPT